MTAILGITDGDDGGACLLVDGRVVAAVGEERLNRMKMSIGFPHLAIREVLRLGGVEPTDVDRVAMAAHAETFHPVTLPNKGWFAESTGIRAIRNEISSMLSKPLGNVPFARGVYRRLKRLTMGRRRAGVRRLLRESGIDAPIDYHEHHHCHALAAFDASGFERALSLSLDGGGDGHCSHVYAMDRCSGTLLNTLDSFDSIGNYYAYVTHLCGYRASIHEGKITGLSASGDPVYLDMFRKLIRYEDGQIRNVGRLFFKSAIATLRELLPSDWEHRDLAASIQTHLEDVAVAYVRHWLQRSGERRICLSGGVFANVRLNQRIAELPECDEVFIYPAMGDGGLAPGAAYASWRSSVSVKNGDPRTCEPGIREVYLGPSFTDDEIEQALDDAGVRYRRCDDIELTVAKLIHEGRVVARFNGRMEYGPRALGNRSILYHTRDPAVNDWLNKRLHRTEFMPFAPACRAENASELFDWNEGAARAARFMTITMDCSPRMRQDSPAVVHIDGTARPQVVDADTNPSFHRILTAYHELSGIPAVVNTSFNMHEEPIVCTPADAVRAFQDGRLDNLAIGPFLLESEERSSR